MGQTVGVLRFRLFNIPVSIRPSFLVIAAVIGFTASRSAEFILSWVGVIFVSILVHELGHALTARSFGSEVRIELNGVGGLTSWTVPPEEFGPGRRALVAAAGSAVGVLFGGLVWVFEAATGPYFGLAEFIVANLIFVNVFWGLLNWLPLRPLDGGHLLESLLERFAPRHGERIANVVFFTFAAAAFGLSLWFQLLFVTLLSGWLLWSEFTRGRPRRKSAALPPMTFDDPPMDAESPGVDTGPPGEDD